MSQTRQYELVYIVSADATEQTIADLHAQVEQTVQRFNSTLDKTENWGRRKLAYEIRHMGEAWYFVLTFDAPGPALHEATRVLAITDGVLRFMATNRIPGSSPATPADRAEAPAHEPEPEPEPVEAGE